MSVLTYMKCHLCGTLLAESSSGYEQHMKRYHAVIHVPTETRKRTKAEIVQDYELRHYRNFIDGKVHDSECSCNGCFERRLSALLDNSEKLANESN